MPFLVSSCFTYAYLQYAVGQNFVRFCVWSPFKQKQHFTFSIVRKSGCNLHILVLKICCSSFFVLLLPSGRCSTSQIDPGGRERWRKLCGSTRFCEKCAHEAPKLGEKSIFLGKSGFSENRWFSPRPWTPDNFFCSHAIETKLAPFDRSHFDLSEKIPTWKVTWWIARKSSSKVENH